MGMFDKFTRSQAESAPVEKPMVLADGVKGASNATPEQMARAAARLRAAGITPTAVRIAEEIASEVGGGAAPAAPAAAPAGPGAGRVGAQPSAEMLERIKLMEKQKAADSLARALAARRAMSGAR
jgi:hypothetical protein